MSAFETILERDGYPCYEYEPNGYDTCRDCKWSVEDFCSDAPLVATVNGKLVNRGFCVHIDIMDFIDLDETTGCSGCTEFEPKYTKPKESW